MAWRRVEAFLGLNLLSSKEEGRWIDFDELGHTRPELVFRPPSTVGL